MAARRRLPPRKIATPMTFAIRITVMIFSAKVRQLATSLAVLRAGFVLPEIVEPGFGTASVGRGPQSDEDSLRHDARNHLRPALASIRCRDLRPGVARNVVRPDVVRV